jgi:hypothetical protein
MSKKSGVRGEAHPHSKLTGAQVREIRERAKTEPHKVLAWEYGVHPATITKIKGRLRWGHLE